MRREIQGMMKVYTSPAPTWLALVDMVRLQGKFNEDTGVYTLFIAVSQYPATSWVPHKHLMNESTKE